MNEKICVYGLGYVGLPLALAFSEHFNVVGFDIDLKRIEDLKSANDRTKELNEKQIRLGMSRGIKFTYDPAHCQDCNIHIVTVPTPIDNDNCPDLGPLINVSTMIGQNLKRGDLVIYESTVYPGVTEEVCATTLAKSSGLSFNVDFFVGYSPERINPGDKHHSLTSIPKVTSGSTPNIADKVDELYGKIIKAGTHKASSIQVAEAAKVIENIQRDVNIALINELAQIFHNMKLDTHEILEAAKTKWNFLPFSPGLVGGHCIGVDPYYLTHKSQLLGYEPKIIMNARIVNNNMGRYVARRTIELMTSKDLEIYEAKVLILGFTFKENCADIRNTKVIDIINELKKYDMDIDVHDPWADHDEVKIKYNIDLTNEYKINDYDSIILAVSHKEFENIESKRDNQIVFDVKSLLKKYDGRL